MLTIAAIAPIPTLPDPASARPGGEGDGFAPVLAALLTSGKTAPTIAPPVAAMTPDAPEQAFAPPPPRQAGTPLPPTGTPAPLAAALMPMVVTPMLGGERQRAVDDARLLVPGDVIDTVPGEATDPAPVPVPQRNRTRAEEPYAASTTAVVALPPSRRALPADDRGVRFLPTANRPLSPEVPVEADDQLVPASEPDAAAVSACTPPGDPVASAVALPTRPGDAALTATPASVPARAHASLQPPADRVPSGPAPVTPRPVDRDSLARPADGSDLRVAVPQPEVATPRASSAVRPDRTGPDTNSADAAMQPVPSRVEPEREVAAPLVHDEVLPAAPKPVIPSRSAGAEEPALDSTADAAGAPARAFAPRPAPVPTATPDPDINSATRAAVQADATSSIEATRAASARTATPPLDMATAPAPASARPPRLTPLVERSAAFTLEPIGKVIAPPSSPIAAPASAATRAAKASTPDQRDAKTTFAQDAETPTPVSRTEQTPASPRPPVASPLAIATPAPITASADQARPAPASSAPSSAAGAPVMVAEPVASTGPPATSGVSDAARPAFTPTRSPATVEARPARTEPLAGLAPAPVAMQPAAAILPAFQAFGAALHRAAAAERRPALRDTPELLVVAPALPAAQPLAPVDDPTPLDTTQARWPDAMIGRIEQLRDLANEADTRIRLHPDALGTVDVALRREGDAVRVHFTAAEPATAKLLADAQPRLQELAEAKGLKLGGAPVDSGNANTGERRQPATPQPGTPARPRGSAAAQPEAQADTRLA